jgi:biotin carboxyl carrier protein
MALHLRSGDLQHALDRADGAFTLDGAPAALRADLLRHVEAGVGTYVVHIDNRPQVVTVERTGSDARVTVGGVPIDVQIKTETDLLLERFGMDVGDDLAVREVRAPMPGLVLRMLVEPGQAVEPGDGLVVLEAMKMENELRAAAAGTVAAVHAAAGAAVAKNDLLISFE